MYKKLAKQLVIPDQRPFVSCHASHLVLLPNDEVLAVWFGGSAEGADDVAIWGSIRSSTGHWSAPMLIADQADTPHWNPVLFRKADGELLLFYKIGRWIKSWSTLIKTSGDGRNWSQPQELVQGDRGGRGPVRNKMIVLSDGSWLAPASTEEVIWKAFVDKSSDEGKEWVRSGEIMLANIAYTPQAPDVEIKVTEQSFAGRGVIQPTLWESQPGIVHMLLRSSEGKIYRSDSSDYGASWCDPYPTALPNNNSGIDLVKLCNGMLVLAYNPVEINWGKRSPLVLCVSKDNGVTWDSEFVLEDEDGEFSYPAILADGNRIYVTYTWNRVNIVYWEIEIIA